MQEGYIHIGKNKLFYKKFGHGARLLIALHGFAHDHKMFNVLQKGLAYHFTVYSIDLPYHGRSQWKDKHYDHKLVERLVHHILKEEQKDQFSAIGFSYGARLWMSSLPFIEEKLSHLYLLAPDGLKTQWLGIAERSPRFLISILSRMSNKPERLYKFANRLRKLRLINRFAHRFVLHHLSTIALRNRLFQTWRSIKYFRVDKKQVKEIISKNRIQLSVIVGKRDSIITLSAVKNLVRGLPNTQLHLLNKSHFLIDGSIVPLIR